MPPEPQPQDPLNPSEGSGDRHNDDLATAETSLVGQAKKEVPIEKILLPQKEVRKVESARRVSAGVLLDQEQKAGREGLQPPAVSEKSSGQAGQTFLQQPGASASASLKEESIVQPLETYQGAIEQVMRGKDISVVSIAAAEAKRRAQKGRADQADAAADNAQESAVPLFKKILMTAAGFFFITAAAGTFVYVFFLRPTTVGVAVQPNAPFILIDETKTVLLSSTAPARDLMGTLDVARQKVTLSLGLVARLLPAVASSSSESLTALSAQQFLSATVPNIPPNLLRTIEPNYLLGVHVYDTNQPFLMLKVDSYQEAFLGMLAWEFRMPSDLAPLFTYVPRQHIPEENIPAAAIPIATSTATSTSQQPIPATPRLPSALAQKDFIDKIVENHDARVLVNSAGDIYLLWTFIDRNTLVITTNAATLREIISRLRNAPVTALPGQ